MRIKVTIVAYRNSKLDGSKTRRESRSVAARLRLTGDSLLYRKVINYLTLRTDSRGLNR